MNEKYYYVIHVQADLKNGYSVAVNSDEHLDTILDEDRIIKLAVIDDLFEEKTDYRLVDMVYEVSEEEYIDFRS